MLAGLVLLELIDRQEGLASLHILDVAVAAAARQNNPASRELPLVTSSRAFGEIAIVLRGVPAVTRVAANPGACVNIVLPELADPVFRREVTLEALAAREIIGAGSGGPCHAHQG
jgi:hypothetical protein